jgi:DNA invertase Pin-like site-specific DNA recombinase
MSPPVPAIKATIDAVHTLPAHADGLVAELEAGLISERTKAALAAARARGVKLGNPNGARALRGKQVGNKQAVAAVRANAARRAANLRAIVDDLRSQGFTSCRDYKRDAD